MLSENLQSLRKARGLSQEELAERIHVVRQTVSKWEKGLSVPAAPSKGIRDMLAIPVLILAVVGICKTAKR